MRGLKQICSITLVVVALLARSGESLLGQGEMALVCGIALYLLFTKLGASKPFAITTLCFGMAVLLDLLLFF
jgi:hypothetical protein